MAEPQATDDQPARAEYLRRRAARRAAEALHARLHRRIANARVAAFAVGLLFAWLAFGALWLSAAWLLVPLVAFIGLVVWHDRIGRRRRAAARAVEFYDRGLTRLDERWSGTGDAGERYADDQHPNAADLDLFGKGSLFELLCTARTRQGQDTLAAWLKAPAGPAEVTARQAAVRELRDKPDLREDLAVLGADVPAGVDVAALRAWGTRPSELTDRRPQLAARVLSLATIAALTAWVVFGLSILPLLAVLMAEGLLAWWLHKPVSRVIGPVEDRADDLSVYWGVLARLEAEHFQSERLVALRHALDTAGQPPSRRIAQLVRLIEWLNSRRNPFFAPFAPLLLWTTQSAYAIERWRTAVGPAVGRWFEAVGEIEALACLATYAYENAAQPFPDVTADGPRVEALALGHPLLPRAQCVRNDVMLTPERQLLVISGSNMSGKSTYLRTVGINAVLAFAGAPVRAAQMRVSPLVVGATLRIQDSLQAGRSRFFTEITRIRQLVDLARKGPILFLLDEMLQGTNSHDRRIGAEAIVKSLLDLGSIGLVTTHDLALTEIADRLGPRAANVHFEDHFENGTMTFDYQMRPGVVRKSNALALMRAVGIDL